MDAFRRALFAVFRDRGLAWFNPGNIIVTNLYLFFFRTCIGELRHLIIVRAFEGLAELPFKLGLVKGLAGESIYREAGEEWLAAASEGGIGTSEEAPLFSTPQLFIPLSITTNLWAHWLQLYVYYKTWDDLFVDGGASVWLGWRVGLDLAVSFPLAQSNPTALPWAHRCSTRPTWSCTPSSAGCSGPPGLSRPSYCSCSTPSADWH